MGHHRAAEDRVGDDLGTGGKVDAVEVDRHRRIGEHIGVPVPRPRGSGDHEPVVDAEPPDLDPGGASRPPPRGRDVDGECPSEAFEVEGHGRHRRTSSAVEVKDRDGPVTVDGHDPVMDPSDPAYPGQKDYTPRFLSIYDRFVIGFMAPRVWRSPVEPALQRYREHLGHRHLDIGPGTGYFLDEVMPDGTQITLLDPNPNVLTHAGERLARFDPETVEADVLKPLPVEGHFDSAALSFVVHCLPGPMDRKATAFANIAEVLSDDGVLFGGTVLGRGADHTWPARQFLRVTNRTKGFDNLTDSAANLEEALRRSFQEVEVEPRGSIAYFVARRRRR